MRNCLGHQSRFVAPAPAAWLNGHFASVLSLSMGSPIFWNEGDGRNSLAEGALARIEVLYADDSARQRWSYFAFDIGGNKYRLIAAVHFNRQMVFIRMPTKT